MLKKLTWHLCPLGCGAWFPSSHKELWHLLGPSTASHDCMFCLVLPQVCLSALWSFLHPVVITPPCSVLKAAWPSAAPELGWASVSSPLNGSQSSGRDLMRYCLGPFRKWNASLSNFMLWKHVSILLYVCRRHLYLPAINWSYKSMEC